MIFPNRGLVSNILLFMFFIVLLLVLATLLTTCAVFILNSIIIAFLWFWMYRIIVILIEIISFCKRNRKIWWRTVFDYLSNNTYSFLWKVVAPLLLILYIISICLYTDKEKDIWILIFQIIHTAD